jgi:hypothetical protein
MLKLYKRVEDGHLDYHEAWADSGKIIEHWGTVGARGETREHPLSSRDVEHEIARVLVDARERGFEEIELEDHVPLIVEYRVDDMGTPEDLEKRYQVEARLNELLGWTGLGACDGGSIGSGTMEVACYVVDFEVAERVVRAELEGTPLADFSRIYAEDADEV